MLLQQQYKNHKLFKMVSLIHAPKWTEVMRSIWNEIVENS